MSKLIILIIVILLMVAGLVGVYYFNIVYRLNIVDIFTGEAREICLNGVVYYDRSSSITPAYNINGTLIGCNRK